MQSLRSSSWPRAWFFGLSLTAAALLSACEGCRGKDPVVSSDRDTVRPTLRLYLVSDLAGALEPCGCVKDQLGGLDKFLGFFAAEDKGGLPSATLSAGPLFFMDATLPADRKQQEVAKADTLAEGLAKARLLAFAPAENDFAAGDDQLDALAVRADATALGVGETRTLVRELGGVKLGVVGLAKKPGVDEAGAVEIARAGVAAVRQQGAEVVVVLTSLGRGAGKRIADALPDITAVVVGSPSGGGDANTDTPPGELVGGVLVAETGNHLQTVAVLDLTVRGKSTQFADASNLADRKSRRELDTSIKALRAKVGTWQSEPSPPPELGAKKAELESLVAKRAALDVAAPPAEGSYFRYRIVEVRESLGKSEEAEALFSRYYKQVNESNKQQFADRKPEPPTAGEPHYVGVDQCSSCHAGAKKVWDKTAHARAYATLADQFKEFNLDCVGCHVTGYEKPGGSTVTAVAGLTNVQCEVCHGPGSKHVQNPSKVRMPIPSPTAASCTSCHHPPHVHTFDATAKLQLILGPGHGRPE